MIILKQNAKCLKNIISNKDPKLMFKGMMMLIFLVLAWTTLTPAIFPKISKSVSTLKPI